MSGRTYDSRRGGPRSQPYQSHALREHDKDNGHPFRPDHSRSRGPRPSVEDANDTSRRRERSRSPVAADNDREGSRRHRMARLRAENEEDEKRLQRLDATKHNDHSTVTDSAAANTTTTVRWHELEGLDETEQMKLLLGLDSFGSTKNQKVDDNHQTCARGAAAKHKARKYRQYMNRKNGFNRPLDKID